MAEVKNAFIKSKMNKDLDSRLLPSGEYRDGQNIQVSKSEGEDVGALENVVGNLPASTSTGANVDFSVISGCGCNLKSIGVFADTNSSTVYVFLTDYTEPQTSNITYSSSANNYIYAYNILTSDVSVVAQGAFLNFSTTNPIYGINVLENLLFWTDNRNQPRKLNVDLASDGTYYVSEDLISVAKYNPYQAINLYYSVGGTYYTSMQDVTSETLPDGSTANPFYDQNWPGDPDYLESKFVMFSYRFKFNDGEYSILAPFTQEAFIPKQDGYFLPGDEDKAYRSTIVQFMENKVNNVGLYISLPFNADVLNSTLDVSEIDILYKESDSLNVKVLDSVPFDVFSRNSDDTLNQTTTYLYDYQSRKPYKTLPESEIIRVYDKVPVRAYGQEVIGNRIVYSNFQDKHTPPATIDYDVAVTLKNSSNPTNGFTSIFEYPEHTVKQNRNYQVGFVLSDRYGRQSTTILSPVNSITQTVDGITYGGSTFYHKYMPNPALETPAETNSINSWPGDSLKVLINTAISSDGPRLTDGWPGLYNDNVGSSSYNPLGWYSYKVVVKQTEQEYYNVFVPGILNGYPDHGAGATTEPDPVNTVAFITILGDNINKVPKDLTEVGPDQKQFRSSVELYGRVTPSPAATPPTINIPYYPIINPQTVSTIATQDEMFKDDTGGGGTIGPPYSTVYQQDSNPYLVRLAQGDNAGNPIGSLQQANYKDAYNIHLGIFETAPVESLLEIFWETSTAGLISDLNAIAGVNNSVSGWINFNFVQTEGFVVGNFATALPFSPAIEVDFADQAMALSTVSLVSVFNANGDNITSNWALDEFNEAGQDDKYNLRIVTSIYYSPEASKNTFIFTFNVRNDDPSIANPTFQPVTITNQNLINVSPTLVPVGGGSPIAAPSNRTLTNPVTTFAGVNGFVGTAEQNKKDLIFNIINQNPKLPALSLNSETGVLTETSGTAFGIYTFDLVLTDSGGVTDELTTPISVLFGEAPINDSFGKKENIDLTGGLESVGVYWGAQSSYATMIGSRIDSESPVGMQNNASGTEGRAAYQSLELPENGLVASPESNLNLLTPNYKDNNGNLYSWKNSNYRPSAFDAAAGSAGNDLTVGTAYIKVDFSFTMWPYEDASQGYPTTSQQIGIIRAAYLQYRPDANTAWTTATDVEGQEMKFGATQQNVGSGGGAGGRLIIGFDGTNEGAIISTSSFGVTGVLNDSTESVNGIGGGVLQQDTIETSTTYPASSSQGTTTSTASKVFAFGKDESYDNTTNDKFGEYRLLIRYPQTPNDQKTPNTSGKTLDITPTPTNLRTPTIFGENGANLVNSNIKVKLSFGDFYYKFPETSFQYMVSPRGRNNVGYADNEVPSVEVWAREWSLRYVTQFYNNSDLTEKWIPNLPWVDGGGTTGNSWYSYSALGAEPSADGTENASIQTAPVTPSDLSSSNTSNRLFVARFDADGKKFVATAQPVTSDVSNT
jgi:hypothetical protein